MENATKVCPYCGQVLGAEETFCTKCGQMYNTSNNANTQQQAYTTNNQQQQVYTTNNQQQQAYTTSNQQQQQQQVYTTNNQQQVYTTNNGENVSEQVYNTAPAPEYYVSTDSEPVAETVSPEPKKTREKKKKTGLIVGIIVAVIVIAAAVVCAIKFGPALFNKNNEQAGTEVVTADGKKVQLDDDTYLLEMYPEIKSNKKELKEMASVIEKRVKVLGDDYEISSDSEKISLKINQSMLGKTPAERAHTLKLIESNGKQAIMQSGIYTSTWPFDKDGIKSLKIETVDKDEFVKENKDYFSEVNIEAFKNIPAGDINIIRVKAGSELIEAIEDANDIVFDDETLVIATDIVDDNVSDMLSEQKVLDIIPIDEDDYKEFYVVSPQAQSKKNAELVVHLLENGGFDKSLQTQLIAEPEWETESTAMGKNQEKSIDGDAVTFEYTPSAYTLSYMEGDEYDEYIQIIKERLDALDTPYAIGYNGIEQRTIVVKISPEKMSSDFGRLIFGTNEGTIYTQFKSLSASINEMEVIEDHNGAPALKVKFYDSKAELYATYSLSREESYDVTFGDEEPTEIVDDGTAKPVYLVINDVNVASADLSEMSDDNTLIFSNFLFAGDEKITKDDIDVLNMFKVAKETYTYIATSSDEDFNIEIKHYDGKKEVTDEIKWGYDAKNEFDNEMIKKVEKLGHNMTFSPGKRNTAVIEINVKINDGLAKNFCEEVKTVYNECGFGDGAYAGVIFKVKNEGKKSTADRCRLVFSKDSYDKVELTYMDYISGPTFSEYWSDFYDILEEDEFFVSTARY